MGNGLIFAFVVALWAAYFVPLAVRRYDEASKTSSLEKLSSFARIFPHPEEDRELEIKTPEVKTKRITREAARVAARRRRNVLFVLTAGLAATAGAAAFNAIAWSWVAIPTGLIGVFLVAARLMVRSELGLNQRSVAHTMRVVEEDENTVVLSHQFEDVEPDRKHVMEKTPLEPGALDDKIEIAVPVMSAKGEPVWEPLPVTLPTYVTKPRVGRTIRTINFGESGAWTSGHIEGQDVDFPVAEGQGDNSRAVGE